MYIKTIDIKPQSVYDSTQKQDHELDKLFRVDPNQFKKKTSIILLKKEVSIKGKYDNKYTKDIIIIRYSY
jgi:hypothetical protein